MLIRCHSCQALFSLQDGVAAAGVGFKVECGRCLTVFEANALPRIPPERANTPTVQRPVPPDPGPGVARPALVDGGGQCPDLGGGEEQHFRRGRRRELDAGAGIRADLAVPDGEVEHHLEHEEGVADRARPPRPARDTLHRPAGRLSLLPPALDRAVDLRRHQALDRTRQSLDASRAPRGQQELLEK